MSTMGNEYTGEYVATTTTNLPSAKEYSEAAEKEAFQNCAEWSEPQYQCPRCGGGMRKNLTLILTTYPAKYIYVCDVCKLLDYQYV